MDIPGSHQLDEKAPPLDKSDEKKLEIPKKSCDSDRGVTQSHRPAYLGRPLNQPTKTANTLRPLQPDHETRVALYEMLWFQDCIINARDATEADFMRGKLIDRLTWLEENH